MGVASSGEDGTQLPRLHRTAPGWACNRRHAIRASAERDSTAGHGTRSQPPVSKCTVTAETEVDQPQLGRAVLLNDPEKLRQFGLLGLGCPFSLDHPARSGRPDHVRIDSHLGCAQKAAAPSK